MGQLFSEHSSFTFDFYMLNWCSNSNGYGYDPAKYGTTLTGTPTHESPYSHKFGMDNSVMVCKKTFTRAQMEQFSFMIQHDYRYELYLDSLPSAVILRDSNNQELQPDYSKGIPIGQFHGLDKIMIYNHLDITVQVHDTLEGHHRIVGFEVEPYSMAEDQHRSSNHPKSSSGPMYLTAGDNQEVTFSYNIITRPDPMTTWSMRMDHYVKFGDNNIHLAAILYALATIAVGVLLLIYVLQRALGNDFK